MILIIILFQVNSKEQEVDFDLFEVIRGDISQEISEVGQLKKGEEINLAFKSSGTIQKIYVEVGDQVNKWDVLAKIDTQGLNIQLEQAKSDMKIYQANLDKLLIGASPEEIERAEITFSNAQISLENAQQNLENIESQSEENLKSAYEDILNILNDSYLKIYNAFLIVDSFQKEYFSYQDEESIKVKTNRNAIEESMLKVRSFLDTLKNDKSYGNIDVAISEVENSLITTFESLSFIRETSEESIHRYIILDVDKALLDIERTSINTVLINFGNFQQTISSTKLLNESNINIAQTGVSIAEGSLATAENELALITVFPQKTDIDLYEAQLAKAESQVKYLENQIQESYLYAPVDGQIAEIKKKTAEMILSGSNMIVLLPADPFQIEVDIYEEDIIKINVGNPVDISLVAFPDQIFNGDVISINPAEQLIDGVVYYKIKINLENIIDQAKPGMTADLIIKTDFRENVLIIPEDAIEEEDGKITVEVSKNGDIEERQIEIGLDETNDDMIEIISGLLEGEKVVIR
ncbi:MAG: efflux RND transporter periplasmic adaptor subunit [Promethearchaeota archaeon]